MLTAALCHDTNHDGVNNAFHMNSYDELALTYNDTSLLESMHARKCFETSLLPGCEIFKGLEKVRRFRTVFVLILTFFVLMLY